MATTSVCDFVRRTFWRIEKFVNYRDEREEERFQVNQRANLVSSLTENGLHAPVLDLDVPAYLIPSSTPGHSHLYIDVEIPWSVYRKLLRALARAGIIEDYFYKGALDREQTMVRPPWVKKEE